MPTKRKQKTSVEIQRQMFIKNVLTSAAGRIRYIKQIIPTTDVLNSFLALPPCKGDEITTEYHLFEILDTHLPIIHRWRLRDTASTDKAYNPLEIKCR